MFTQTADQELFEATTARFLETNYPPARVRELADQGSTFDAVLWKQGAEFGWTTLLVPEDLGGGSISGNGLADLLIIAFQFGRHAAPGPLIGTNVVAAALGRWGSKEQQGGPLAELLGGSATAAHVPLTGGPAGQPAGQPAGPPVRATVSGDQVVLDGRVPCVERGAQTSYLLVAADDDGGARSHYLVPLTAPGVQAVPLGGVDLTRRYDTVVLRQVTLPAASRVGEPGAADAHEAELLDITAVLQSAEIVGAMQRAFDMTLQWTRDRYSFGRPLGSYQEIKHRMADLRTQLEASGAIAAKAAQTLGEGAADARSWASAAKAYVGRVGPEAIQDCIQLHGGIGVTYEHDLHLFLRRAVVDAQLFGTPAYFNERLVRLLEADLDGRAGANRKADGKPRA